MANNSRIVNHPGRSAFDLSYSLTAPMDMGILYPVQCDEVVPGDTFHMSADVVLRAQPMVAPLMHEVNIYVHTYFVPYRILWTRWKDFITGGRNGEFFDKSDFIPPHISGEVKEGSLGDFLGYPIGKYTGVLDPGADSRQFVSAFPLLAYNSIFNWYYRDENFTDFRASQVDPFYNGSPAHAGGTIDEGIVSYDNFVFDDHDYDTSLAYRSWEKDYFTSALPFRQRGIEPRIPVYSTEYPSSEYILGDFVGRYGSPALSDFDTRLLVRRVDGVSDTVDRPVSSFGHDANSEYKVLPRIKNPMIDSFYASPNDIRLAMQLQRWMERNARAGIRYNEFIKSHFGVDIQDYRLQQPEYIGGLKQPLIVSEVLQTSSTDATSPQGNLAGHGISVGSNKIGSYFVREYGLIMSIMSIMPKPAYHQGLPRQLSRRYASDFFFPEFSNLPEQAILKKEIFYSGTVDDDEEVFGYQGRFDEMRIKYDRIAGALHSSLNFWTIFRNFDKSVKLNYDFLKCNPSKNWLAVPSEPAFIASVGNRIKAIRPLPEVAIPGLIDHN